jgi:PAS domain S-box-containing protein
MIKILLIEDNPLEQQYVKELIARFNGAHYELVAEDLLGKSVRHFADGEIGVILLDLNLPDSHGLDTFRTVHRLAEHIPIVILTGIEDDTLALQAMEGGAQDYLVKGQINTQVLQKAVRYAIERHRILQELKKTTSRLKKEEETLNQRENTLQTLLNAPKDTIALLNSRGTILEINESGASRFGRSRADLIGTRVYERLPPDIARTWKEKSDRVFQTGQPEHFEDTRDDRSYVHHIFPIHDAEGILIDRVAIFATDITEQKKTGQRLSISESLYRTVFEATGAPSAILDDKGIILRANCEVEAFFGYSPAELEGKVHWSRFVPPDEIPRLTEKWRLLHEDPGSSSQHYEARLVDRWGRIKYGILLVRLIPHTRNCIVSITDITERRRADEAIAASEERFRGLFDHMTSGVAVYQAIEGGNDFIFQDFNQAAELIEGVTRKELLGRRVTEIFPGIRQFGLLEVMRKVWETGSHEYLPVSLYKDENTGGSWRENWVYKLPTGEIVAVYNEISDRIRAEEALKSSEAYLKIIFDSVQTGLLLIDPETHTIHDANTAAVRMFGAEKERIVGSVCHKVICPAEEGACPLTDKGQRVDKSERIFIAADETRVPVLKTVVPVTISGREFLLENFVDISERKLAEQALRESEEMFRNPIERSPVGVFLMQDGIVLYVNSKLAEMAGYTREELLDHPFDLTILPDDVPGVREEIDRLLRGDVSAAHIEYRSVRKNGTIGQSEAYGSCMLLHGRPAIYGTIIDITERKRMADQIQRSLREKEVLLREIHHRVKNNMQVISSLLSVQAQNIKDDTIRGLFKESQNRIRSIALVHELLYRSDNLDQIDYGAYLKKMFIPLFESYSIDQRMVSIAIEARNVMITIEKAVPCSLIVNELISNSLKHAFPGDRKGAITIRFGLDPVKGEYALDYCDDGVGLPPGLDVRTQGTLGIRLIDGLTKQLGGTLEVLSGEGTRFRILFPAESSKEGSG